ncbi:hypothetical protein BH20ACT9_BH20ACT9_01870 [soil metagenome]
MDTHDSGAAPRPAARQRNGAVVAALVAAGVGCAALGLSVVLTAASASFETLMDLYAPAGPLTGKTTVASAAYLGSWVVLHRRLRHRDVDVAGGLRVTAALVALGLLGTFPPFFELFATH